MAKLELYLNTTLVNVKLNENKVYDLGEIHLNTTLVNVKHLLPILNLVPFPYLNTTLVNVKPAEEIDQLSKEAFKYNSC